MTEGWFEGEYLSIFSPEESSSFSAAYNFKKFLPGYTPIGFKSWDDFIAISPEGALCTIPTIPLDPSLAEPFELPESLSLEPDGRFKGKIKWYVKPLVFGGEPEEKANLSWVSLEQHSKLVVWWNEKYLEVKNGV